MELQIVAFPREGSLYPNGKALLEGLSAGRRRDWRHPHFRVHSGIWGRKSALHLRSCERYQVLVDVHCDEIDDEQSRFIETLATLAYERGIDPGHCQHTTAMHSTAEPMLPRLFRLIRDGGHQFRG